MVNAVEIDCNIISVGMRCLVFFKRLLLVLVYVFVLFVLVFLFGFRTDHCGSS